MILRFTKKPLNTKLAKVEGDVQGSIKGGCLNDHL
jgi:hypothetical protein